MKQDLLDRVKQEILPVITNMTMENMDDQQKIILTYFDFMQSLKALPEIHEVAVAEGMQDIIEEVQEEPVPEPPVEEPKEPDIHLYTFERKLRGGVVAGLEGGYLLPEKLVRDMGLEHGDKVRVSNIVFVHGQNRYRFELAEKASTGDAPGRVEVSHAIVASSPTTPCFIITRTVNGPIEVNGEITTLVIAQKDSVDFNIKSGDVVDIAYYENNTDNVRILHKHDTEELTKALPKKPAPKKAVEDADDKEVRTFPIDMEFMKGKTITIVGSEYEKMKYQQAFAMLGMKLNHMTGDEGKVRLRTAIRKSDVVVVTTQQVGHKGSVPTAELCKEYDVPMAAVEKNGVQYILLEAEKVMKRKLEQVATA